MYCDHPSCKKFVEVNSVNIDDKIVNVCKHCGKSEHLKENKDREFDTILFVSLILFFI